MPPKRLIEGMSSGSSQDRYPPLGPKTIAATKKFQLADPDGIKDNSITVSFSVKSGQHELIR